VIRRRLERALPDVFESVATAYAGTMGHHMHHMHHHHYGGRGSAGPGSIVVMYVVGALMFAMAVGFFVVAESSPLLYLGFTIAAGGLAATGVIMLVVAIAMGRKRAKAVRLMAGGVPGQVQ
jgi:hypothetical protein